MRGAGGRLAAGVAAATMALACGGDAKRTAAPAAKPEQDGLWRFAPAGTEVAVVLPDGTLQEVADAILAAEARLAAGPEPGLSVLLGNFEYHGVDLRVADQRAAAGFDPRGGMAVFHTATDRLSIYPVPDPDAYRRRFGVKRAAGPDGLDVDREGAFCIAIEDRYACARQPATLRALRERRPPGVSWGAGLDGHVQVYVSREALRTVADLTAGGDGLRLTIGLSRGGLRARARLAGAPQGALAALDRRRSPLLDRVPNAVSGLTVMDLRGAWAGARHQLAAAAAGSEVGGVRLDELVRAIRGDLVTFAAAGADRQDALAVGLSPSQPVERLLRSCEDLDRVVPGMSARRDGGRCQIEFEDLAALGFGPVEFAVEGDALVVTVSRAGGPVPAAPGRVAWLPRIRKGRWSVAGWGTGLALHIVDLWAKQPEKMAVPGMKTAMWALLHLVEVAFTLDVRGSELVVDMEFGTTWAYPAALQAQLEPLFLRAASGETIAAEITALAARENGAELARHVAAGSYGLMTVVAIAAFGAGFALGGEGLLSEAGQEHDAATVGADAGD